MHDVYPLSDELRSYANGKLIATKWNEETDNFNEQQKKNPKARPAGMIKLLMRAYKKNFGPLFLTVPLTSLCGVCSPICVR